MAKIKASNNKAKDIVTAQPQAQNVTSEEKANGAVRMVRERLKFYVEQFNFAKKQQLEMKEQLDALEETGLKLSGSINALNEMLKSSERL